LVLLGKIFKETKGDYVQGGISAKWRLMHENGNWSVASERFNFAVVQHFPRTEASKLERLLQIARNAWDCMGCLNNLHETWLRV
jgi:hypothetical protein